MVCRPTVPAVALLLAAPLVLVVPQAEGQVLAPDLVPTALATDPGTPEPGAPTTFEVTVQNQGLAPADTFDVAFFLNGEPFGEEKTVEALSPGGQVVVESDIWTTEAGNHTLRAVVDVNDDVQELNEDNNAIEEDLEVGADLRVTDLVWAPEEPRDGQDVRLTGTLENRGPRSTDGPFRVRFLVDGTQIGRDEPVTRLDPGDSVEVESAAWNATTGTHTVRVIADVDDEVAESNETNNDRSETLDVLPPSADLVPVALEPEPSRPEPGEAVVFEATVENQGGEDAGRFEVRFLVNGEPLGEDRVVLTGLAPGERQTLESDPWEAEVGDHDVTVEVDPDDEINGEDRIEESNETNNALTIDLVVGADLVALDVLPDQAEIAPGETVQFTAEVANNGTLPAENATVRFSLASGTVLGTTLIDRLAPGERTNVTSGTWAATNGSQTVRVSVDTNDNVTEANETNNEATDDFLVSAHGPDLTVTAIDAPTNVRAGDEVTFSVTVTNMGDEPAGPTTLRLQVGATIVEDARLLSIPANGTRSALLGPWEASEGTHIVRSTADVFSELLERNETNNTATTTITVLAAPGPGAEPEADLLIEDVRVQGARNAGTELAFVADVRNVGGAASGPFTVRFSIDHGAQPGSIATGSLAPGQARSIESSSWNATAGTHQLQVVVDAGDQVQETSENNNARTESFGVLGGVPGPDGDGENETEEPELADLVVTDLRFDPDEPADDEDVRVHAAVENIGEGPANRSTVRVALDPEDGDRERHVVNLSVPALAPGESFELTTDRFDLDDGTYAVEVMADSQGVVEESDENNNAATTGLDVEGTVFGAPGPGLVALVASLLFALAAAARRRP